MKQASANPLFTRSEKRRVRKKISHKIKGAARKGIASLFGIPLSPGLGGKPTTSSRRGHRSQKPSSGQPSASTTVRRDVIDALRGQGYTKAQAEKMAPAAQSGDTFDSLFRRAFAKNPGELIIFGNPAKAYTRKGIAKAKRAGNPIPLSILQGLGFGVGEHAAHQALKTSKAKKKSRRNPGSLDRAEELFSEFHHRSPSGVFETQRSAKHRKDYTILGPLVAIGVNPEKYEQYKRSMSKAEWEEYKVDYWDKMPHLAFLTGPQVEHIKRIIEEPRQYVKDCPQLASSPNGKQLYAITPDGVQIDLKQFDTDTTKDFIDLGDATFVVYVAKKPDQAVEWIHELGEETGDRPRLALNRLGRGELFFVGGRYTVEGPGIIN